MAKLTPKRAAFAREFAAHGNAAEAYRKAGYSAKGSENTLRKEAYEVLHDPLVAKEIARLQAKHAENCDVTIGKVTTMLEGAYLQAMRGLPASPSAAVAAAMGLAKLHGLIVDRSENKNVSLTHEEWLRSLDGNGTRDTPPAS